MAGFPRRTRASPWGQHSALHSGTCWVESVFCLCLSLSPLPFSCSLSHAHRSPAFKSSSRFVWAVPARVCLRPRGVCPCPPGRGVGGLAGRERVAGPAVAFRSDRRRPERRGEACGPMHPPKRLTAIPVAEMPATPTAKGWMTLRAPPRSGPRSPRRAQAQAHPHKGRSPGARRASWRRVPRQAGRGAPRLPGPPRGRAESRVVRQRPSPEPGAALSPLGTLRLCPF